MAVFESGITEYSNFSVFFPMIISVLNEHVFTDEKNKNKGKSIVRHMLQRDLQVNEDCKSCTEFSAKRLLVSDFDMWF